MWRSGRQLPHVLQSCKAKASTVPWLWPRLLLVEERSLNLSFALCSFCRVPVTHLIQGSFWDRRTFLHAEEGLWLAERGLLAVNDGPPASLHCVAPDAAGGAANSTSAGAIAAKGIGGAAKSSFLSAYSLWETLSWSGVPWECYRAYAELKRR